LRAECATSEKGLVDYHQGEMHIQGRRLKGQMVPGSEREYWVALKPSNIQ